MIIETVVVGPMEVNCYILASKNSSSAVIIDPGDDEKKITSVLEKHKLSAAYVINTHGHYDHIGCDDKFGAPIYIHKSDLPLLKDPKLNLSAFFSRPYQVRSEIRTVEDNQLLDLEGITLRARHMPGHTPGGIALILEKPKEWIVFTGDSLFCQGVGRSDLEGGDGVLLVKSIKEKLLTLPDETIVYPGHGPSSTIAQEKRGNPFLM